MADGKKNKVKFGLRDVHYAKVTETDGVITYGVPKPILGAVSISLSPQGDPVEFYADDMQYFNQYNNDGYEGDLTLALIPDEFKTDCLGETIGADNVAIENADAQQSPFALLFSFQGDATQTRHVLYYCMASRPNIASSTKAKSLEVQPETLSIKVGQRPDTKDIKAKTTADTTETIYDNWYKGVYPDLPQSGG